MLFTNEDILKNRIRQNAIKRIIFTILCFLIILPLIGYNLLLVFELKIMPEKLITVLGVTPYIITTNEFLPDLYKGDIINVKEFDKNELKSGDIIIYKNGKEKSAAKISKIVNMNGKLTIFVNFDGEEKALEIDETLGIYESKIFDLGLIVEVLQDKILLVYLILIIYVIYMRNSYKTERSMIRKLKKEIYDKKIQES